MGKLDRDLIVDTATQLIAADGEAALSMRVLAQRLGVTAMALYRHFPDRDALLVAVVERVSAELVLPPPAADPVRRAVEAAGYLHGFLVTHPWMIRLIATGRLASPAGLRFPEVFLSCAIDAGTSTDDAFLFYRTMFATVLGQATFTHARGGGDPHPVALDTIDDTLPVVSRLRDRWRELDTAADAAHVFHAVARTLRATRPDPRE